MVFHDNHQLAHLSALLKWVLCIFMQPLYTKIKECNKGSSHFYLSYFKTYATIKYMVQEQDIKLIPVFQ